jgi:hypothetical protein
MNVERVLALHVSLMNDIAGEINNADKKTLLKVCDVMVRELLSRLTL